MGCMKAAWAMKGSCINYGIECVQRNPLATAGGGGGGGLVGLVPVVLGVVAGTVSVLLIHGAVVHAGTGLSHESDGGLGTALEGVGEGGEEVGAGGIDIIVEGEEGLAGDLLENLQRKRNMLVFCNRGIGCDARKMSEM